MTSPPLDLGPLPKGDRNDDLQQLSMTALRAAVPVDRFLFRDERGDDKGIDASVELKAGGGFTGIRSYVQLKGTDEAALNADGSFSLPVAVSNLNYLLNGPAPLYVLWVAPRQELRHVWARDEAGRLHRDNPGWMEQKTVTLRFQQVLAPESWEAVFDRILREGRLHRETHDSLIRTASVEPVTVRIDAATLAATTDQQAYEWVTQSGLGLVSAGHAATVRGLVRMLPPARASEARVRLVSGYAAHSLGDYFAARQDLGRANADRATLTPQDRYVLEATLLECDYRIGKVGEAQYQERRLQLETEAPDHIAAQLRLDRVRYEHIGAGDPAVRAAAATELRATAERILSDPDAGDALKLQTRLVMVYADAADGNVQHIDTLAVVRARADMRMPGVTPDLATRIERAFEADRRVDQETDECAREAARLRHPVLIAEATLIQVIVLAVRLMNAWVMASQPGRAADPPSVRAVQPVLDRLVAAEATFRAVGSDEGVVRAVLLQADWLVVCGRDAEAVDRARSVEGVAHGIGFERHIRRVARHLAGATEHHQLLATVAKPPNEAASLADRSDADLRHMASLCLAALNLPPERLPVVEREWFSSRDIAREQVSWCRHIELIQDLRHELSPTTHFRTDPTRFCVCTRHRYESAVPMPDWPVLIAAFKDSRCVGCPDRLPRGADTQPGA